jgi:hypothetical protein
MTQEFVQLSLVPLHAIAEEKTDPELSQGD